MDYAFYKISPLRVFDSNKLVSKLSAEDKKKAIHEYKNKEKIVEVVFSQGAYALKDNVAAYYAARTYNEPKIIIKVEKKFVKEMEETLIARVKTENLNPMFSAILYEELKEVCGYNQSKTSKLVGKTQGAISNKKRLLKLPHKIQVGLMTDKIKERHGRALLQLHRLETFEKDSIEIYQEIINNNLNVQETEDLVFEKLGKEIKQKENLIISELTSLDQLKSKEIKIVINQFDSDLGTLKEKTKAVFGKLDIEISQGLDKEDYVFVIKLKGVNK